MDQGYTPGNVMATLKINKKVILNTFAHKSFGYK